MLNEQSLRTIFEKEYNRADWYNVLRQNFYVETLREPAADITSRIKSNPYSAKAFELGSFETPSGQLVGLYEVHAQGAKLHRNRRALRDLLSDIYRNDVEAALVVFVQDSKWRFTYVSEITERDAAGTRIVKSTDPKRYTYLFGIGEKALTAARQFSRIKPSEDLFNKGITLESLLEAFNVEKMSKAFFNEYRKHYGAFTAYLTGEDENSKDVGKSSPFLKSTFGGTSDESKKEARDFVKKMLGRIVFLYFLEKKGWLGVPVEKKWGEGDENFLSNLFAKSKDKDAFYSNVLAPLFFGALNTERKDDIFKLATGDKVKIPFLNGGLFEEDEPNTQVLVFPKDLFANLFEFFDRYNFTVYEDSPDEHTVAVDPEMLGHIFENLLEDNKDKGTFYTPREIVHYMCQGSLVEYLYTKLNEGRQVIKRGALEKFVKNSEAGEILDYEEDVLLALHTVKICDPAIGSGAFPMGILMEIFHAVETLFEASAAVTKKVWKLKGNDWVSNRASVKMNIIQNSIYGVDIEQGAVDIARLRFWLSLVVDEDVPKPLPNLDYKIVVGNSLISKFDDVVIDIDWNIHGGKAVDATKELIKKQELKLYDLQHKQHLFFVSQHGDKKRLKNEIRNLKIEILSNQLELTKIAFQQNNPILGGFAPTDREQKKNIENRKTINIYSEAIAKIKALKASKDKPLEFFDWKLDFPEVMNKRMAKGGSGFDIVIANPPYGASLEEEEKEILKAKYKHLVERIRNSYLYFQGLSFDLLKTNGSCCLIIPNEFLFQIYMTTARTWFLRNTEFLYAINLGDGVFDAIVPSCIIGYNARQNDMYEVKLADLREIERSQLEMRLNDSSYSITSNENILTFPNASFSFDIENATLLNKLMKLGEPFETFCEDVANGISTSCDGIYIVDEEKVKKFKLEKHYIKPCIRGGQFNRYYCPNATGDYVLYIVGDFDKSIAPNTFQYLKENKDLLIKKSVEKKTGLREWHLLFRARYRELFNPPKILIRQTGDRIIACEDRHIGYYCIDSVNIAAIKPSYFHIIPYLLGIINSRLFEFIYREISQESGRVLAQVKPQRIRMLPIIKPEKGTEELIVKKVNEICKAKSKNPGVDTTKLERQLDLIIYKLYKLSYVDVCLIENSNEWLSEGDYESVKTI